MKRRILDIMIVSVLMAASASCALEETFEPAQTGFDGTANLSLQIDYRPMSSALDTKSDGKLISGIDNLSIIVYHADGVFHSYYYYGTLTGQQNIDVDDEDSLMGAESPDALQTNESKYQRTTIDDISLVNGNFRIYAVANLDRELTEDERKTEDALKAVQLTWDYKLPSGTTDPTPNATHHDVMFGFFTDTEVTEKEITDAAPIISINKADKQLHAWVRRAASKVTVSFDGSDLNEDVWISFKSVQIKHIPRNCTLGKDNTPTSDSELIENGETIYYSNSDDISQWPYIAKGDPYFGSDHSETADALYFFENMQGVDNDDVNNKFQLDTDKDGFVDGNDEEKDLRPYGTYIEVKAFYVNKGDSPSQGYITYRFMLGKNVSNDFNAERNIHYKVNMKFLRDANNVDWHIDYVMENPEISVATPLYISYLHRQSLDIPVAIRGGTVESLTATIIENNWYYDSWFSEAEHADITKSTSNHAYNGFLSFKKPTSNNSVSMTQAQREQDFNSGKTLVVKGSDGEVVDNAAETRFKIKVWTRAVQLGQGFSGNNTYIHKERSARIAFTAVIKYDDGSTKTVSETIEVKQVKRLVNPMGIWRKNGSDKSFNIQLLSGSDEENFYPIMSDGAWTARVVSGKDWVKIAKTEAELGSAPLDNTVTGSTGSYVDFWYKPVDGNVPSTRCGVIEVLYHGNTCVHYVFVSQGSTPVAMTKDNVKWHISNVHSKGKEEASPCAEGSLFRYGNLWGILAENNARGGAYAPFKALGTMSNSGNNKLWAVSPDDGKRYSLKWPITDSADDDNNYETEFDLGVNQAASTDDIFRGIMPSSRPASCDQWNDLKELSRYYGVMYGEESSAPAKTAEQAYGYLDSHNDNYERKDGYGMRGMFVWDREASAIGSGNGNHIFFPIGATGHGHRFQWGGDDMCGVLRYSTMEGSLGQSNRPLLDDLYLSPGAIYWCGNWYNPHNSQYDGWTIRYSSYLNHNLGDDNRGEKYGYSLWKDQTDWLDQNAMDINYHTYDFNFYRELAVYFDCNNIDHYQYYTDRVQSSDACLIRCVDN